MTRILRAFIALTAAALSPAAAQSLPVGPEILAGTEAVSIPSVALGADGSLAAAWHPKSSVGAPFSPAVVRTYNPTGHPLRADAAGLGGEPDSLPRIAALPSGRYAAAWLSGNRALVRLLDTSGAPSPAVPTLDLGPASSEVLIDAFPSGESVTGWKLPSGDLVAQRVDALGRKAGAAIPVADDVLEFSIAAQPDGGFHHGLGSRGAQPLLPDLWTGRHTADAALLPTTSNGSAVRVSADAGGRFVIAWDQETRIVARRFRADGEPREAERTVVAGTGVRNNDVAMRPRRQLSGALDRLRGVRERLRQRRAGGGRAVPRP